MKVNKVLLFLVLGAMLLLLYGCFQLTEEYWVNEDGTGKLHFEIGMSQAVLDMAKENDASVDTSQIFSDESFGASNPYLKNVTKSEKSDDSMHYYLIDADVTDFSNAFKDDTQSCFKVQVEKLANGNYSFKRIMDLSALTASQGYSLQDIDADMTGLMAAMFGDKYWIVRLHSENVVSTNGTWDKDKKLIEWKMPFSDLFSGKETIEMTAEINTGRPPSLYLLIGGGVLLLVIVVAPLLIKRVRAKNQPPPPPPDVTPLEQTPQDLA